MFCLTDHHPLPPLPGERFALEIVKVSGGKVWPFFAPHHYLTDKFSGHHAFLAVLPTGEPVAFTSIMAFPHGKIRHGWRGHRTVVLPDFQGLGIGARLDDWRGEWVVTVLGGRFFAKTSHPRLGAYRDRSPYWRPTASNRKKASAKTIAAQAAKLGWVADIDRDTWSHEYLGRGRDD